MAGPFSHLCLNQPEVWVWPPRKEVTAPINERTTHMAPYLWGTTRSARKRYAYCEGLLSARDRLQRMSSAHDDPLN
jgi:hypothetical protein